MSSHDEHPSSTQVSLLSRLQKDDQDAWIQFVDRYGNRLFEWCGNRGLQTADAEDVTQNVLIKIARSIKTFEYDRSMTFRGWLRTVTENAIVDYQRERQARQKVSQIGQGVEALDSEQARQDLMTRLSDAFDLELLEHAMDRVRARVDHRRWLAWKKCTREDMSGREVAEALKMPVATVYAARFQVQKLITEEIRLLEHAGDVSVP